MEASWDDDNFVPTVAPAAANRWEGEDEDDDVKESWEDDDEEKLQDDKKEETVSGAKSKKKTLAEKIAEKERLRQLEIERKRKEEDDISPEEKIRRQKESDLNLALETTFGGSNSSGLDKLCPATKEEFDEFSDVFLKKVRPLATNNAAEFVDFTENLVRNLCATLSSLELKKIKTTIDNLVLEKQRMEKGDKGKKKGGKGKVQLKLENDNQYSAYTDDFQDYDDFM